MNKQAKRLIVAIVAIVALGVVLTGCTPSAVDKAKAAVAEKLRDPDSAKFRNVVSGTNSEGLDAVCGEVNGKNTFGAYSGYERFMTNTDAKFVYLESESARDFAIDWITKCP